MAIPWKEANWPVNLKYAIFKVDENVYVKCEYNSNKLVKKLVRTSDGLRVYINLHNSMTTAVDDGGDDGETKVCFNIPTIENNTNGDGIALVAHFPSDCKSYQGKIIQIVPWEREDWPKNLVYAIFNSDQDNATYYRFEYNNNMPIFKDFFCVKTTINNTRVLFDFNSTLRNNKRL
ncbi:hypothetical protein GpSGHVEth145 [Glossina pallidipes salivary gland hypertrophy virus]|uniref:Uncharacterized protein n=1 Tax=Glossina hytrovirus (isolate Glossina pallidipes/Ethiopia/Seibersdorf/-) TaxID=379529 RepID=A0A125QZQ8_GHVS|nr:hypothetical protein GpSGHVEth145 [Glossina pallidipes salivary gland hypertrophy virus]